jgi:CheY-like chemotaxis protein
MRLPDKAPRIPLADDNAINRRVAELMLKHAGFTVDIATDGTEAVEAHTSRPYDLILMDSQMPAMDGFEATRCIRQLDQPQPVIIAITANALRANVRDALPKDGRLPVEAIHSRAAENSRSQGS